MHPLVIGHFRGELFDVIGLTVMFVLNNSMNNNGRTISIKNVRQHSTQRKNGFVDSIDSVYNFLVLSTFLFVNCSVLEIEHMYRILSCMESSERQKLHIQVMEVNIVIRRVDDREIEVSMFIKKFCCKVTIIVFFSSKISKYQTDCTCIYNQLSYSLGYIFVT